MRTYRFRLLVTLAFLLASSALSTYAAAPGHIVISQVQHTGANSEDEFVELFNPTQVGVNMAGWRLSKKTSTGTESNLLTTFPEVTIHPSSFLLIVHKTGYQGQKQEDVKYSTSSNIASNGTVLLYSDAGQTLVDKVGMGTAADFEGTAAAVNPGSNESVTRKDTLLLSGFSGPAEDTDDNSLDFELNLAPNPRNALDPALPVVLLSCQAYWSPDGIRLEWRCEQPNLLHWHVWRADLPSKTFERITQTPIQHSDTGSYEYFDTTTTPEHTYLYLLETLNQAGESARSETFSHMPLLIRDRTLATTWCALKRR